MLFWWASLWWWAAITSTSGLCPSGSEEFCYAKRLVVGYSVNSAEGFNLRRDVLVRMLVAAKRAPRVALALPAWPPSMYHWKRRRPPRPLPWRKYFDADALKAYAPHAELYDEPDFEFDRLYALTPFDEPFEDGRFVDRWAFNSSECAVEKSPRSYELRARATTCVAFQGAASKLLELAAESHPEDSSVAFADAQIALHDEYGTREYWLARKAVRFRRELVDEAKRFVAESLPAEYLAVHWRRGDFARGRPRLVPTVAHAAAQIAERCRSSNLTAAFVATDAEPEEFDELRDALLARSLRVVAYSPPELILAEYFDGGVAIIDQIVCSLATRFVGTHESTFTFRIQEEREILGRDSDTTFDRLCPDEGPCEKPARWTIVN